jgi:two-component system chemotaxis response regulator CheB
VDIGVVGRAEVRIAGKPFRIQLARGIESEGIFPSADCLFGSMGKECGPGAIGVVLAGRGDDGAVGAKSLLKAGGTCLVQSPGSGYPEQMTQATMRHAPSSRQIPLEKLGDTLCRYIGELSRQLSRSQDGSVA